MILKQNQKNRFEIAKKFIQSLKTPPIYWKVSGSTARGDFRNDSDIDICVVAPKVDKEKLFQEILNLMQDEKIDIKILKIEPIYLIIFFRM